MNMVNRADSQRKKITKGVLSCYTSHRKTRLFTQEKELKRVHGEGSGNKETQSFNMPREISGSNNILNPNLWGKEENYQSQPRKIIALHIFNYWIFVFLNTCLWSVILRSFCEHEN